MTRKHQLVCNDADRPPVGQIIIIFLFQYLRRQYLIRAALRLGFLVAQESLGQAKIDDFKIALTVEHQIRQLEVPVHDIVLVQLTEADHELGDQASGLLFWKVSV